MRILGLPGAKHGSKARKKQKFLDDLSNSGPAVRGHPFRPKSVAGSIWLLFTTPTTTTRPQRDEAMSRDTDTLNDEMVSAGVRIFVGGLSAASTARSLRARPDGKVLITDGPYLETKEQVDFLEINVPERP